MKFLQKNSTLLLSGITLLILLGCKPPHHPKNPNYTIIKPKIIHTPSKKSLDKMVKDLQGSPYVWAEEGPHNFDCSGFTYYLYGSMGIDIPRVAREQAKVGKRIQINALQYGDLIFFATGNHKKKITHVGMYLGKGWFTHASTIKYEVVYSNLYTSPYYKKRLRICRRYLPETKKINKHTTTWETDHSLVKEKGKKAIVIQKNINTVMQSNIQGNYYIQVGSFIGKPKSTLLHSIQAQGYQFKIIQFPKAGKSISKLLIGPYMTRIKSVEVLEKIQREIQKDAFIAEIR